MILQKTAGIFGFVFHTGVGLRASHQHTHRSTEYQNRAFSRKPSPERSTDLFKVMQRSQFMLQGSSFGETNGKIMAVNLGGFLQNPR